MFLLVALTAACVGYALASVLPPLIAGILSQVLVVFVLMFSPAQLPARAAAGLAAGDPCRAADRGHGRIDPGQPGPGGVPDSRRSPMALLAAWCAASFGIAFLALNRRG